MFVKNILKAFDKNIHIAVFMRTDDDSSVCYKELDYETVDDVMNSGLMNYMEIDMPLRIINNYIVIYIK